MCRKGEKRKIAPESACHRIAIWQLVRLGWKNFTTNFSCISMAMYSERNEDNNKTGHISIGSCGRTPMYCSFDFGILNESINCNSRCEINFHRICFSVSVLIFTRCAQIYFSFKLFCPPPSQSFVLFLWLVFVIVKGKCA